MHETADKFKKDYVSPKGAKLSILTDRFGLFFIHMTSGGIRPSICNQKYTSFGKAKSALDNWIASKPEPKKA